jgi:polysaccharide pyruvyl transferase WcaK-like protein
MTVSMPTILLINDTSDHDNWGSQACAEALKCILKAEIPDVQIRSIYSAWMARRYRLAKLPFSSEQIYWKPNRLYSRFSKAFEFLPNLVDQFEYVANRWERGDGGPGAAEFIENLHGVDAVVFNAEGSTYRNNYTAMKGIFLLWYAKTRHSLPAFFLNGSLTITSVDRILPGMIRKTFEVLDGVSIREPASHRNLHAVYPEISAKLIPDSVFYLLGEPQDQLSNHLTATRQRIQGRPYFCFSLSMLPMDYRPASKECSLYLLITGLQKLGLVGVLLAKDGSDQFLASLAAETDAVFFGPEHNYEDLRTILHDSTFLVTGRYHHAIMAAMEACPTITLTTTSQKMEGLVELFDKQFRGPYDATDIMNNLEKIFSDVRIILTTRTEIGQQLHATAQRLKTDTLDMGRMVLAAL